MNDTKIFVERLSADISKAMEDKRNIDELTKHIIRYIDKNNDKLQAIGPMKQIFFSDADMNIIYKCSGITEKRALEVIKEVKSTGLQAQWSNVGKPYLVVLMLMIREASIKKKKDLVQLLILYMGLSSYFSLFRKYFQFEPNPAIMEYTINNLSNKYKIKQLGTMYAAIVDTMKVAHETGEQRLINGLDKDLVVYIQDKKTRLNDMFKNIRGEFEVNYQQSKYMNVDYDSFEEDDYRESNSDTFEITRVTDKVLLKLLVEGPQMQLVNLAAKLNQVSVNELRNYSNVIITGENKESLREVIESIVTLFISTGGNKVTEIRTNKFLQYSLEIYKKSNTNDKNIIRIKSILDKWLKDVGLFQKTNRLATINSFRKALFTFFVFSIEKYN